MRRLVAIAMVLAGVLATTGARAQAPVPSASSSEADEIDTPTFEYVEWCEEVEREGLRGAQVREVSVHRRPKCLSWPPPRTLYLNQVFFGGVASTNAPGAAPNAGRGRLTVCRVGG